jgi:hypothetical protein
MSERLGAERKLLPGDATALARAIHKSRLSARRAPAIRGMVRFLRRHGCSQGQALTLGGVAETFVALNRGPRVEPMDIWSG